MVKKILITGGIGSGKSKVSHELKQLGYIVWDADLFARTVLFLPKVRQEIEDLFGPHIFQEQGILNREKVRKEILNDASLRQKLEGILHPAISHLFKTQVDIVQRVAPHAWIFYEASLILENGKKNEFDFCLLIIAEKHLKIERLKKFRDLQEQEVLKIMDVQMPDEEKKKFADFVIENNNSEEELRKCVKDFIEAFQHKNAYAL